MSKEADEKAINVKSGGFSRPVELEAATGDMPFEISVISVGAILILLLLVALIFTPGRRGRSENAVNHSGIYLQAVHLHYADPPSPNPSICVSKLSYVPTAAESPSVSPLHPDFHPPWSPKPPTHWQHEGADA